MKAIALLTAIAVAAGGSSLASADSQDDWSEEFARSLPLLGHRNFIVVADSAYPLQSNPGIRTIYTGEKQINVVKKVLAAVEKAAHVNGTVYLDQELSFVPEEHAAGIDNYRSSLEEVLAGRPVQRLPHMDIIRKLDDSSELFNVLILKTDLTLPYTSVFVELGAGYWNEAAETELRESMK